MTRSFDLGGGVTNVVEVRGSGPPVVLLHGFTGDASTMAVLAEPLAAGTGLADGHRVIVPNLIGHGGSIGTDETAYSIDAMADQVLAILDRLEPDQPVDVVGYSMGGRIGLTLACRNPQRVRSLVLIGASAGLADPIDRAERVEADEALAASIETDGLEQFVDRWMANPLFATQARLGPDRLAGFRAQRLRNQGAELARSLRGAGTGRMRPLHDELASCAVPTMLIVGEDDEKFRAIAKLLAADLGHAEVVTVAAAGHAAHLEQPAAVVAAIRTRIASRTDHSTAVLTLPLRTPLVTARGTTRVRESLLHSVTRDGITGWGEAAPLPGWSAETLDDCARVLALDLDRPIGDVDSVPAARAAVVGARLDLEARRRRVLLRDLLAERFGDRAGPVDSVEVNAVVTATDPDRVAIEVAELVAQGFATVKIKVAALPIETDVARVAYARRAAPEVALRLDANGGWDHDDACWALGRLAEFDIALCEEPVAGIEEIAAIGAVSPIPVAVDESARTPADLERVWSRADSIAAVVLKPQALGGADRALEAITRARRAGVDVVVTTMIESAVGVAHAAHVAAAAGLPGAHGLDTSRLLIDDVAAIAEALPIVDGRLSFAADTDRERWGDGLGLGAVSPGSSSPS